MITVALAQMVWAIAFQWRSFTGGDDGISAIPRPNLSFLPWSLTGPSAYFYFVLIFFILSFLVMFIMVSSPFGKIVVGIRENELRMRALGYNTVLYKYVWFIISGIFAGVAGILFTYLNGYASPVNLSVRISAEGMLMVLLGGPGTLIGPAIGSVLVVFMEHIISSWTARWSLVLGVIYVIVVVFLPQGILGLIKRGLSKGHVAS
jgi:branched-chain amino acid transport system permease protein